MVVAEGRGDMLRKTVPEVSADTGSARPPLWLLAIVFFGLGDLITTSIGISVVGVVEAGPVTAPLLQRYGLSAIVPLKSLVFGCGYLAWKFVPQPHCVGIPLALSLVGISVTGWNIHVLVLAVLS